MQKRFDFEEDCYQRDELEKLRTMKTKKVFEKAKRRQRMRSNWRGKTCRSM